MVGGSDSWETLYKRNRGRRVDLGVATAAVVFCTRNYRVNKHLESLDRTRFIVLETASLFVDGVSTDEARTIVTAELVRAVFASGDTGYITRTANRRSSNPGSLIGMIGASARSSNFEALNSPVQLARPKREAALNDQRDVRRPFDGTGHPCAASSTAEPDVLSLVSALDSDLNCGDAEQVARPPTWAARPGA